jgi:hypothetical protein
MTIEHQIKTRDGGLEQVALTPVKAIRRHCLECSNFQWSEVRRCPIFNCALFPYRLGKRPGQVEPETESEE